MGARLNKGTFTFLFVTSVTFLQIPPYKRKGILRRMEESKGIAGIPGNSEEIWILGHRSRRSWIGTKNRLISTFLMILLVLHMKPGEPQIPF